MGNRHIKSLAQRTVVVAMLLCLALLLAGCTRSKPLPKLPSIEEAFGTTAQDASQAEAPATEPTPTAEPAPAQEQEPTATPEPVAEEPAAEKPIAQEPTATPTLAPPTVTPAPPTATPAPPTPVPTPTVDTRLRYTVRDDDTLYSIAQRHKTTIEAIVAENGLADETKIYIGQELALPPGAEASGPEIATIVHTVALGESLSTIARQYDTVPSHILDANPYLPDPNHIEPGLKLVVPVGTAPAPIYHVVQYGETLSAISQRYGVSIRRIVQANGLRNANAIYAGQQLKIPQ